MFVLYRPAVIWRNSTRLCLLCHISGGKSCLFKKCMCVLGRGVLNMNIPDSWTKHSVVYQLYHHLQVNTISSLSQTCYILNDVHLAITDFIEKTALVVMAQNSCSIHFVLKIKHYIVADVCGWMLEHKLISHMKARNYQAIWDVCGQWTWLLNKVWCNGLFSMSSSAILTIMFQLFMVLLSECF